MKSHTKPEYNRRYYRAHKKHICAQNCLWAKSHRKRINQLRQLARYGMTEASFKAFLKKQRKRCAICRKKLTKPYVDHDHQTNRVRGLLCNTCNSRLYFFDRPRLFWKVMEYLGETI